MTSLTRQHVTTSLPRPWSTVSRNGQARDTSLVSTIALLVADCAAAAVSALLADPPLEPALRGLAAAPRAAALALPIELAALFAATLIYLALKGRYHRRIPFWTETRIVVCASLAAAAAQAVIGVLADDVLASRPALIALLVFPFAATAANRLAKHVLARIGVWTLPVLVVGNGQSAADAEAALGSDRSLGYRFVGRVDPVALMAGSETPRLWPMLHRYHANRLLVALDLDGDLQRQVIECALRERIPFAMVPPPYAFPAFSCETTRVFSHDTMLISFRDGLSWPVSRAVKAAIDVVAAALLLAFTSPLFLILSIIGRLDGGPILYAHWRVGAGGRPFRCLKFRTMVVDADAVLEAVLARDPAMAAEWRDTRKLAEDPRVTRLGRFLRQTSLDELPQLINVLRREMSLVGPRPIVESEIHLYGEHIAQYYATRPGLTGLWQVSGRSTTSYARRVQLDVWYVNNWTIWHDFTVLLKTIPAVFRREGAV